MCVRQPFMRYAVMLLVLGLLIGAGMVSAHEEGGIRVAGVWARATEFAPDAAMDAGAESAPEAAATAEATAEAAPMMIDVSAAYLSIINAGGHPIRLTAASTPAAEAVGIHDVIMDGDVMQMREVEGGLTIAAGETAVLEPGGFHLMLLGLTAPLVEGTAIPLMLTFDMLDEAGAVDGEPITLTIGAPVLADVPLTGGTIELAQVWARPTLTQADAEAGLGAMIDVSAGYLLLTNTGESDMLIGAETPVASVELHEMMMDGDVMRMRELADGLPVPTGETVALEPGGFHLMLLGLTEPLLEGTAIPVTLLFASGLEVTIGVPVYDAGMGMGSH